MTKGQSHRRRQVVQAHHVEARRKRRLRSQGVKASDVKHPNESPLIDAATCEAYPLLFARPTE